MQIETPPCEDPICPVAVNLNFAASSSQNDATRSCIYLVLCSHQNDYQALTSIQAANHLEMT